MLELKLSIATIAATLIGVSVLAAEKPSTIIKQRVVIDAEIDQAWQVLGPEYAQAYKWGSSITHSEARNNESLNGSTCTERGCSVSGMGNVKEKILQYSEDEHILSYEVIEGMPKMVDHAINTWELSPAEGNKTLLEMQIDMGTRGFLGWMMGGMMKMKMTKLSKEISEEFKYYVETGKPHPRKVKSISKNKD